MKIVSNSGPVIHLAQINALNLLKELFEEIVITGKVKKEVVDEGQKEGYPDTVIIEKAICDGWIKVIKPKKAEKRLYHFGIHQTEAEVISCAVLEGYDLILLDDDAARELARTFRLRVMGSIGVVIRATKRGIIPKKEGLVLLDSLTDVMYLNSDVYRAARLAIEKL